MKRHGHPVNRKDRVTRKNRSKQETKFELKMHYLNFHKMEKLKDNFLNNDKNQEKFCIKCQKIFSSLSKLKMHRIRTKH